MLFPPTLLNRLRETRHLVVLTGAGVSQESGIPTFRDALTGLWARFDAEQLATPEAFLADPALVWGWYEWRRGQVLRCQPNAGHRTIAELARRVPRLTLITQNVDGLHERAGSPAVLALHGSLHRPHCADCGQAHPLPDAPSALPDGGACLPPPRCGACGGLVRPGVVWFGESLPVEVWQAAQSAAGACDLLLSVGTSSLVSPAAELPVMAADQGALVVQINPAVTALNAVAQINLRGTAARILPELLAQAWPDDDAMPAPPAQEAPCC
ncbi:NAD-dependent deacylase [Thiocystis minor]|uniref:SIR2 family NAD-dependent protein deacylase n=1 Tax=Thiocystis minor TaxID=61597 RepID=UPI0019145F2C|nr:NAD-dependent deacylase [Thiocystis minor]MBK5962665.1 NAD-dependent deacylase [Thiocystis minor]